MTGDDIKALRAALGCTARDLAGALGIEQAEVLAWERGELFPTKRHVTRMESLRATGLPKKPGRASKVDGDKRAPSPAQVLARPEVWRLVRKLLAHPALLDAATTLADAYPDPADD